METDTYYVVRHLVTDPRGTKFRDRKVRTLEEAKALAATYEPEEYPSIYSVVKTQIK